MGGLVKGGGGGVCIDFEVLTQKPDTGFKEPSLSDQQ